MTSHSDYARTREPKPMQVWEHNHALRLNPETALVLEVNLDEEYLQVKYRKIRGLNEDKVYTTNIESFTRLYHFSH